MSRANGRRKGRRVMTSPAGHGPTEPETNDTDFYNIFDGTKGRPESTYLDMQERQQAERLRAVAEGREAETDLGKLPAAVGTPLVIEAQRVDNSVYSNPPMHYTMEPKDVDPVVTLPVETGPASPDIDLSYAAQVARERQAQDEALLSDAESGESTETTQNADTNTTDYTV